jgi:hypothetical protein
MVTDIVRQDEAQLMESVLLGGDLSKLSPAQRVVYYQRVCESIGLNPLTKPFDYINLNGKLTLYARKDATDQLRKIHSVSIDDVEITETDKQFIVKVKGHDRDGRSDVEVGVVNKSDMRGDTANVQMKAVTKGKRRLTLSLCGLGMLDETEVQTIPDARPIVVADTGEIVDVPTIAPESINQETGEVTGAVELIDPLNSKWVEYAAEKWNIEKSEAAKAIASKKLGNRIDKRDFVQIVTGAPA